MGFRPVRLQEVLCTFLQPSAPRKEVLCTFLLGFFWHFLKTMNALAGSQHSGAQYCFYVPKERFLLPSGMFPRPPGHLWAAKKKLYVRSFRNFITFPHGARIAEMEFYVRSFARKSRNYFGFLPVRELHDPRTKYKLFTSQDRACLLGYGAKVVRGFRALELATLERSLPKQTAIHPLGMIHFLMFLLL